MWEIKTKGITYTIEQDTYCFKVEQLARSKRKKDGGKEVESLVGYYSNFEQLTNKLVFLNLLDKEDKNTIIGDIKNISSELRSAIQPKASTNFLQALFSIILTRR